MLRVIRDGNHLIITPPLSESERARLRAMNLHSYLYEQSGGIEANIRSRRPMLAEAMQRGNREQVRLIQAQNRRALEIV